jgi:hypothetical protein
MKKIPNLIKTVLVTSLCLIAKMHASATHITGGELSYECVGAYTYKITLEVYRDCGGQAPYDSPAHITVWNGIGAYMQVLELSYQGATTLPYISADTNWVPLGYSCVEVSIYDTIVTFPQMASGYLLAYQRCCRTGDIINIQDPLNVGATYFARIPGSAVNNNSPVFPGHPPLALCANRPMTFDHSAYDADGDSLVYHLCVSYDGATPSDPQPYVTSPPPFLQVTYASPFTEAYPMYAFPNFSIDSVTGMVTVTPLTIGNFEVGICCDEYRAGVLIGTHCSDFRYSVAECPYGIGIEKYESVQCEVFPNPAKDFVQFKSDEEIQVMVFDAMGKLVYQSSLASPIQTISTVEWASGIYTYRGFSNKGISTGKLIKL